MLSIIIPARNESDNLKDILDYFTKNLIDIEYEVVLINDFSNDDTLDKANSLFKLHKQFRVFDNQKKGLGGAINTGIQKSNGSKIAIMMADLSDDIKDLIKYNNIMDEKKVDAVLGSRFIKGSIVKDYPFKKLLFNRVFNFLVRIVFWNKYNDYTNAFKIYKADALKTMSPFVSESFNIFLKFL